MERIWRQKSRQFWLEEGDRNTRFFHVSTMIRRKRNFIGAIVGEDNKWIPNPQLIGNYLTKNFKELFSSQETISLDGISDLIEPEISFEENDKLLEILSREEVRRCVWSMNPLKSLGPEGTH